MTQFRKLLEKVYEKAGTAEVPCLYDVILICEIASTQSLALEEIESTAGADSESVLRVQNIITRTYGRVELIASEQSRPKETE